MKGIYNCQQDSFFLNLYCIPPRLKDKFTVEMKKVLKTTKNINFLIEKARKPINSLIKTESFLESQVFSLSCHIFWFTEYQALKKVHRVHE